MTTSITSIIKSFNLPKGLGIRSITQVLEISITTLLKRIVQIAKQVKPSAIITNQTYEVDELITYIGNKKNAIWIIYALDRRTKCPISLKIGKRNKLN